MINYYEILEVSQNASDEIIEKAYKVLAKKYHPDLQQGDNKKISEEKMKIINEAYSVLSNKEKREAYNKKINQQKEKENIRQQVQTNINNNYSRPNVNNYTKTDYNYENRNQTNYNEQSYDKEEIKRQQKFKENLEKEARRRYLEAYDNYLRSLGYKVKYRWTWEKVKALLLTVVVLIVIGAMLWIIPPSREYMIRLYEENFIVKILVDLVKNVIESFFQIFNKQK